MLTRLTLLLFIFVSGICSASLLSQQSLPAQYMQTTEDAAIWAQVGNDVINVGNVRAGQILA
ncbi:polysaccharide deacetylase family protein, partial [Escherichia coli]